MRDIKSFLSRLPSYPGIYQMYNEQGEVIYVGKAKNLKKRIASYFNRHNKDQKTISLVSHIQTIDIIVTHSENEAVLLECNLIKKYKPRYNVLLRDDKSYPYILITQHVYPRIDLYRGPRKKEGLYFGPFPSSLAARETINLLQKIFRLRTCHDTYFSTRMRPCLLYQIGRCTGPCVHLVSEKEYAEQVQHAILFLQGKNDELINQLQSKMEVVSKNLDYESAVLYRDQIARLRQIQERQFVNIGKDNADIIGFAEESGKICIQLLSVRSGQLLGSRSFFPNVPLHTPMGEVIFSFITQYYLAHKVHTDDIPNEIITSIKIVDARLLEKVLSQEAKHDVAMTQSKRGKKKHWLNMADDNAKHALLAHLYHQSNMRERMSALQSMLHLKFLPKRIECFDVSHSLGEATVASCVVFDETGPQKSYYRRFNITRVTKGDDIAAMHQVLLRRFKRLQKEKEQMLPDIVFIDGGKAQLKAASHALKELNIEGVILIGISKGAGRKPGLETLHFTDASTMRLPQDSHALHFIQHIRDEAHRFAISLHRKQRDKTRQHSTLEQIPGVGIRRRRALLRYFGGIQGLLHASLLELTKVPGISHSLAERIFAALHDDATL